jgi:hypothetical protein
MKLGAAQSVQQAKPEGDAVTTPAAALQQDLAEAMPSAGPSETLQRVIARETQERLGVGVDASEILGEQEAPQETVEDKLKLYQAPDLRVQAMQDVRNIPVDQLQDFKDSEATVYQRGAANIKLREENLNTDRYNFQGGKHNVTLSENGGVFDRADNFSKIILDPTKPIGIQGLLHTKPEAAGQVQTGSKLATLFNTTNATVVDEATGVNVVNPEFLKLASLITEDLIADQTMGETRKVEKELGVALADFGTQVGGDYVEGPELSITKMQRNKELGDRILTEWGKITGSNTADVDNQTKTYLGDAMKELYYEVNKGIPEARNLERIQRPDGQVEFRVTNHGQEMFRQSEATRKLYFPKEHVDALDAPRSTKKIRVSGAKKPIHAKDNEAILEAVQFLESIPHTVIPRREKILLATLLPALANGNASPEIIEMAKEINGFGSSKIATFKARERIAKLDGREDFNVDANMEILKRNIAQSLYGIAKHRGKSVYLTYFIQAFNGRLSVEQTHFNPMNSKQVRFVTGSPDIATMVPGRNSRLEENLREMYSMMILKVKGIDAGDLVQEERMKMFNENYQNLVSFGEVLKQALDNTNIDTDRISEAILKGTPLDHPDFPQFQGLQLDPKYQKLISSISKKGEDGLGLIDGLIDLYEYDQVLQYNKKNPNNPRQFHTQYNAYIDGKTNGLASNGVQLGSREIALRTGVIRSDDSIYAVEDNQDLRDVLAEKLTSALDQHNIFRQTTINKYGGEVTALHFVANVLFNTRELNKATTMTFGYGKELNSFKTDLRNYLVLNRTQAMGVVEEYQGIDIESLSEKNRETYEKAVKLVDFYDVLEKSSTSSKPLEVTLVEDLFDIYVDQLVEVITPDGIKARKMMYNMAMFHVLMDEVFEMETPTEMPIYLGGIEVDTSVIKSKSSYNIFTPEKPQATIDKKTGKEREPSTRTSLVRGVELEDTMYERTSTVLEYGRRATASAIRNEGEGGYIGGSAFGGSNPAAVQSIDAATVARTFSGRSSDKLRNASSSGKGYGLQIYDAFKSDVFNFDIMNREVNQNWLQVNKDYFYLQMANDKMAETMQKFMNKTIKSKNPNELVDIGMDSGYRKIGELLFEVQTYNPETKKYEAHYPALEAFFKRNLTTHYVKDGGKYKKTPEEMSEEANKKAIDFIKQLESKGIEPNSSSLTRKQVFDFVQGLSVSMDFVNDRKTFINKIKGQRDKNFAEIDAQQKRGIMVAQYHAH